MKTERRELFQSKPSRGYLELRVGEPDRRKVSDHPALAETLIEKLQTQTALQDDVIKLLEKQLAEKHEELMILVRRLHFEDTATFATETFGVMKKYRDEAFKP